MANEELRFDIIGRDQASGAFSRVGGSVKDMGDRMNIATKSALILDEALKRQQTAARTSVDATLALAKADDILTEAEHALRDGALEAEFALKKEAEAKKKSGEAAAAAAAKNEAFRKSLTGAASKAQGFGPAWLGPALALAPVATSIAGVAAGAAAGLGGAAVAGAGALAAFGAVAKPVYAQALTAEQAVQKAQDAYNVAIANGTKRATAYKAEQVAIGKAYAEMSPQQIALSRQLSAMGQAWQNLKAAETPVVAGALQPWLKSVTDLTGHLAPVIAAVSPVIKGLGVQFGILVNSSTFKTFAAWIGGTGSMVTRSAGNALIDLLTGITFLLPQFTPLIKGAADGISKWGDAFVRWSASQKAADEIHSFLQWFHDNGPAVGGLLKNIGGALKALAPGLGPASVAELNVISGFFAWIAKLPPGLAKPLLEVAGVLLTLNKLGVFKVGVDLVGKTFGPGSAAAATGLWAKLLPGVRLAGGALAVSIIVDTVLKSTSSGNGKNWLDNPFGQGTFKNPQTGKQQGTPTALTSWQTLGHDIMHDWDMVWNNTVARTQRGFHDIAGWFDRGRHDIAAAFSGATSWLVKTGGDIVTGLWSGLKTAWKGVSGWFGHVWGWVTGAFSGAGSWVWQKGHDIIQGLWNGITAAWSATSRWLSGTWGRIVGFFQGAGSWLWQKGHDILQGLWNGLLTAWSATSRWLSGTWGRVVGFFSGAGSWLWQKGHDVLQGFWNGLTTVWNKVTGWISSLAGWIKNHKGPISFDRTLLEPAGRAIMQGLKVGLEGGFLSVQAIVSGAAGNIGNQFSGLLSLGGKIGSFFSNLFGGGGGGATSGNVAAWIQAALAIAGKPGSWLGLMERLVSKESGGNPRAVNPMTAGLSGEHAEGIAQTIPSTFAQFAMRGHGNIWNPIDDLIASVRYISAVWGSPSNIPGLMGGNYVGYASGTLSAAPGWAWVGEHGPELMRFRGGEQVVPAGRSGGGSTYIINVHPTPLARPADIGREVVGAIKEHEKRAGKGWRTP